MPDRADDIASLEDVFTSRSFGQPVADVRDDAVAPLGVAVSASRYFMRSRLVASVAMAAAALSVVAGISVGSGRAEQRLFGEASSGRGAAANRLRRPSARRRSARPPGHPNCSRRR